MVWANEIRREKAQGLFWLDAILSRNWPDKKPDDKRFLAKCITDWVTRIDQSNRRLMEMAGKPKAAPKPASWQGYVDYRLSDDEIERMMAWELLNEDIWISITGELSGGYRFTLSHNGQNDHFVAAFTGLEGSPNAGYTLSAFAPDVESAVRALAFKHFIALEQDWSRAKAQVKNRIG